MCLCGGSKKGERGTLGTGQPGPLHGARVVMGARQCVGCVAWQWQLGFTSEHEVQRQSWLRGRTDQPWVRLSWHPVFGPSVL